MTEENKRKLRISNPNVQILFNGLGILEVSGGITFSHFKASRYTFQEAEGVIKSLVRASYGRTSESSYQIVLL